MDIAQRLEQYTLKNPEEVLLVNIAIDGREDEIIIFKGFSSSLMHPTNFDPEIPVMPPQATILSIDRLVSPYNRDNPKYIQQGLSWEQMRELL